jgi:hypothetical protein
LGILAPLTVFLVGAFALGQKAGVPANHLTRDVISIFDGAPYHGIISTMGTLLWCATAAICLFAAAQPVDRSAPSLANRRFLLAAGALTSWLLIDDQFLFHEVICPQYLGIREEFPLAMDALLALGFLVAFRRTILAHDYLVLLLAGGLLAGSIGMDLFIAFPGHYLVEDGLKLLGIGAWLGFFASCARRHLATARPVTG